MIAKYLKIVSLFTMSFLAAALISSCESSPEEQIPPFSDHYTQYVETLSSDNFEGRAPTTSGGRKTKAYIESEFRRMGLQPALGNSYRQPVPLVEIEGSNFSNIEITGDADQPLSFSYADEMIVGTSRLQDRVELHDSELVFAGFGIVAPEYEWDDYQGLDVEGKTVVVFVNDPGYHTLDPDFFTGKAMTYYGRWTYKYEEAARQGAEGVLIVHETGPAGYGWDVVKNSWSGPQYDVGGDNGEPTVLMEGWLHNSAAHILFEQAGFTLDELREEALKPDFQPFSMEMNASVNFDVRYEESESANIAGFVEGSQRPEETVVYMAHWDHLGKVETDEGVDIYNGAIDNATGTAAIMVIAEKFANMEPAPERTVLFLAVTAEESGLIGSRYYAMNPLFPLETTAGGINIDGLNVYGPTHDVSVVGYNFSDIQDYLERHAREQGRVLVPESKPERGYFYRSDHFNFVREGVPMIYANSGNDFIDRDDAYAEWAQEDQELRYHSPLDIIHDGWDWQGLDQNLWLFFNVGHDLANSNHWPQWREGTEFEPIRQESAHLRE